MTTDNTFSKFLILHAITLQGMKFLISEITANLHCQGHTTPAIFNHRANLICYFAWSDAVTLKEKKNCSGLLYLLRFPR